jgi:hypothetical protein
VKTVLKITLGILLAAVLLIGGCAALIGGAANEVQEIDKSAITPAQYRSISTGMTRDAVERTQGAPADESEFSSEIEGFDQPAGSSCIYYHRKGELLSLYQFCFDVNTGRFESKAGC